MSGMNCEFSEVEPGVYRCIHPNCGITFRRVKDPARIRAAKCRSTHVANVCIHRGEPTGKSVKGCGCHVPAEWKVLYACEIHGECVPRKLHRLPRLRACDGCESRG